MEQRMYYHGSSTALLPKGSFRLLPACLTGNTSEAGRQKHNDRVFFTTTKAYATVYAGRACSLHGGRPVIFRVIPAGEVVCLSAVKGCEVFHSEGGFIEAV